MTQPTLLPEPDAHEGAPQPLVTQGDNMPFKCNSCSSTNRCQSNTEMCGMCGHDNAITGCTCPNCEEQADHLTDPFFFVFDQYLNSHGEFFHGLSLIDKLCADLSTDAIIAARPQLRARGLVRVDDYIAGILRERSNMVSQKELLRIASNGGRRLIEQPRPPRKRKDKLTIDLFDTMNLF